MRRLDLKPTGNDYEPWFDVLVTEENGHISLEARLSSSWGPLLIMEIMAAIARSYRLNMWFDYSGKIRDKEWVVLPH